jgi:ribosome biogenesis GTPase A
MAKALRQIKEDLRVVDLVLLVIDARIPRSSRHPQIERLMAERQKKVILILNKADLADEAVTSRWLARYQRDRVPAVVASASSGSGLGQLRRLLNNAREEVLERARQHGRIEATTRLVVAGIPNVGKSSLINRLSQSGRAKTGKQPGVTKSKQWIPLEGGFELRDSPGILFPRISSSRMFVHLAACGAIKEDNLPLDEVGQGLCEELDRLGRLDVAAVSAAPSPERLATLARAKGMLRPGGVPDTERAAHYLLKSVREGKFGRLSFEAPEDAPDAEDMVSKAAEKAAEHDD